MARTAAEVVNTFLTRAQDAARKDYHGRLRELLNQSEGRPNISDPECFSFWIANLLPIRTAERLQFLRLTDTRERLNQEISRLHTVSTDQGCYIQWLSLKQLAAHIFFTALYMLISYIILCRWFVHFPHMMSYVLYSQMATPVCCGWDKKLQLVPAAVIFILPCFQTRIFFNPWYCRATLLVSQVDFKS
jgi:hypothetical protein